MEIIVEVERDSVSFGKHAPIEKTTRYHIPEDRNLHICCSENLKSYLR
jgi:hypothetical protein